LEEYSIKTFFKNLLNDEEDKIIIDLLSQDLDKEKMLEFLLNKIEEIKND
jgi:hypothetical protein